MTRSEGVRSTLWQLANERRGVSGFDPVTTLRAAVQRELPLSWRDVSAFAQTGGTTADVVDPAVVADFLVALTAGGPPRRVLDPWAGLGITLAALDDQGRIASGRAIEINEGLATLARDLWPSLEIEWQVADSSVAMADGIGSFDLVVGSPPIGLPRTSLKVSRPLIELTASKTYTMLLQSAIALAPDGMLAVVLPEGFWGRQNAGVREAMAKVSVYPCATLALPRRSFGTAIPMCLVVFTKQETDTLFAAELDPASDMNAVVSNFRQQRPGRLPQLGLLTPAADFVSWARLLRGREIESAAAYAGLRQVAVSDLAVSINASTEAGFAHSSDAVYVPLGDGIAVTSVESSDFDAHRYLQMVVDPDLADPAYVAGFLNSALGLQVRAQLESGASVRRISARALLAGAVYLPPTLTKQREVVRVGRSLTEMQRTLGSLERELWVHPLAASRVEGKVRQLLEGDDLEPWMDSLPFPLSSVLWRYVAGEDSERRCRDLIHFFEATALFLVDLHVSALTAEPRIMAEAARRGGRDTIYKHGSIGIWADLLARLAGRARQLLSQDLPLALELYRLETRSRLDAISGKVIVSALKDEAASYRRDWIGHPGVAGPAEWDRRLAIAEATLERIRDVLGDAFSGWSLIRPGAGRNKNGVITTKIEFLVGSRSLFRKGSAELRELPEDGGQYMLEDGGSLALRLRPLFRLSRSPESVEDACYFYDRLEDGGVRWVSFHHESQPEIFVADLETEALIDQLNALG